MITSEREFLKCHERLEQLIETVRQSGAERLRIDEVERTIFAELLRTGFDLLSAFVSSAGNGDVGETIQVLVPSGGTNPLPEGSTMPEVCTWRRLPEEHHRPYMSIFGEL